MNLFILRYLQNLFIVKFAPSHLAALRSCWALDKHASLVLVLHGPSCQSPWCPSHASCWWEQGTAKPHGAWFPIPHRASATTRAEVGIYLADTLGIVNKALTLHWLGFPSEWLLPPPGTLRMSAPTNPFIIPLTCLCCSSFCCVDVIALIFSHFSHFKTVWCKQPHHTILHSSFSFSQPQLPFYLFFSIQTIKINSYIPLFKETLLLQIVSRQRWEPDRSCCESETEWCCPPHRPMLNLHLCWVLHVVCLSSNTCFCLWKSVDLWLMSVEQPLLSMGWCFVVMYGSKCMVEYTAM